MKKLVEKDLPSNIFVVRPDALSCQRLQFIKDNVLGPVLRWSEMSGEHNVLPRLRRLRASVRTHA
eukprot:15529375-Heterocapsa_arctica.AAC.1